MLFRDQFLDDPQLVDAARLFGEPVAPNTATGPENGRDPHLLLISNIRENGEPIGALPDGETAVSLRLRLPGGTPYGDHAPWRSNSKPGRRDVVCQCGEGI